MLDTCDICVRSNKEPWLAGSLSWLLPGIGQLYAGAYFRGAMLIVFTSFLYMFWLTSLIAAGTSPVVSVVLNLCVYIILPVYACENAFRTAKRHNTNDFERERTSSKDPWLAVFLSVLLPGLGHAYLRRVGFLVFYAVSFLVLYAIAMRTVYAFPAYVLLRAIVCAHAYIDCRITGSKTRLPMVIFALLLVAVYCVTGLFIPQVQGIFVTENYGPIVGSSMEPTLPAGAKCIVNKLTYRWKDPAVGDIVMFTIPDNPHVDNSISASKRIVAKGGESVQVIDGQIYVDGKFRERWNSPDRSAMYSNQSLPIDFYGPNNPYLNHGVAEPYSVPQDHYFVLGDNRRYSVDSRCYGAIAKENIIGRVVKISWPPRLIGRVR